MDTEVLSPDLSQHRTASSCTAQRGWHKGQTPPVPPTDAKASLSTPQQRHTDEKPLRLVEGSVLPAPCSNPRFPQFPFGSQGKAHSGRNHNSPFSGKSISYSDKL